MTPTDEHAFAELYDGIGAMLRELGPLVDVLAALSSAPVDLDELPAAIRAALVRADRAHAIGGALRERWYQAARRG